MAQLVEQRIRNAWVAGSSPAIGSLSLLLGQSIMFWLIFFEAELAQLVEHWLPKPRVAGSSPVFRSLRRIFNDTRKKMLENLQGSN